LAFRSSVVDSFGDNYIAGNGNDQSAPPPVSKE
jgi:hypothetical protein